MSGLLVFVDLPGGELDDTGKGILAEGQKLAGMLGTSWAAAAFAGLSDATLERFRPYGAPEVLEIDAGPDAAGAPLVRAEAVAEAARHTGARVVLMAHTDLGSSLAPVIASRLHAALFTEAISYGRDWAGLTVGRHAVGAQVVDRRVWTGAGERDRDSLYGPSEKATRLVLSISPRILSPAVVPGMLPGGAMRTRWAAPAAPDTRLRVVEEIPPDAETMDVTDAPVVFTAGMGCDRPTFDFLCELASLVGASVGVTRPVYDLGWKGFERMIGQTGKTVAPRLYFAFGVSGAMHHVGGITDSKRIVCVNIDPKAPVFPNADEGFVADLREVLPRLLERARAAAGAGAPAVRAVPA